MAHDIVVREGPARPAVRGTGEKLLNLLTEMVGREVGSQHLEGVGHMKTFPTGVLIHNFDSVESFAHFANQCTVIVLIKQRAHLLEERNVFRFVLREDVVEIVVRILLSFFWVITWVGWVVS